eukprot:1149656-Pelagomonas_calceolata.AAC.4
MRCIRSAPSLAHSILTPSTAAHMKHSHGSSSDMVAGYTSLPIGNRSFLVWRSVRIENRACVPCAGASVSGSFAGLRATAAALQSLDIFLRKQGHVFHVLVRACQAALLGSAPRPLNCSCRTTCQTEPKQQLMLLLVHEGALLRWAIALNGCFWAAAEMLCTCSG